MGGAASQGLILNSFAGSDKLANAARALVGVAVACTYPLLFKGVREGYFDIAKVSPANQEKQRTPATVAMVALTVLAGIKITDLGFVVAFGGAILGSAIIYVIPSQIALSACKKGKLRWAAPRSSPAARSTSWATSSPCSAGRRRCSRAWVRSRPSAQAPLPP